MAPSSLGDADMIGGMIWKTLGLGVAATAAALLHSGWMALSVAAGSAVSGLNLAVAKWLVERLQETAEQEGEDGKTRWAVLLGAKTVLLMGIATLAVLVCGLDPLGFIGGYSLFLLALGWETIRWSLEG